MFDLELDVLANVSGGKWAEDRVWKELDPDILHVTVKPIGEASLSHDLRRPL
jgi:hypothetical protein